MIMKFFTDENVATSVALALRRQGFDIKDVKEEGLQGTSDNNILQLARREKRIIITHDKDFGNVLFYPTVKHCGVILLRFKNQRPDCVIQALTSVLHSPIQHKICENVTIVSEDKIIIHRKNT